MILSVLSLKSKQNDLEEVRWPELELFRHPNKVTYTPLKIEIKIFSTKVVNTVPYFINPEVHYSINPLK